LSEQLLDGGQDELPAIVRIANHLLANKNGEEMATLEPGLDGISQLQTHFFFRKGSRLAVGIDGIGQMAMIKPNAPAPIQGH